MLDHQLRFLFPQMRNIMLRLEASHVIACVIPLLASAAKASAQSLAESGQADPLNAAALGELSALYRTLIEAENRTE